MVRRVLNWKVVGLVFFIALGLSACQRESNAISIENAVVRATAPGQKVGVAYLSITNNAKKNITLNYVHSSRIATIEIHQHLYEDGMMKMREVPHLDIGPGETVHFKPGGYHLMLFDLEAPLKEGEGLDLNLEFQDHTIAVQALVKRF